MHRHHVAKGDPEAALDFARRALGAGDMWVCFHRMVCPALVPSDARLDALLEPELPPRRHAAADPDPPAS